MPAQIQGSSVHIQEAMGRAISPDQVRRDGLKIPGLRITADGHLALDLDPPTFHTLVFGSNLVGLTRILTASLGEPPAGGLIAAYIAAIMCAFGLGKLASSRMKDRTPRLYSFGMSFTALVLYAAPGNLHSITPSGASSLMAIGTMVLLGFGTVGAEMLHRLGCSATEHMHYPEAPIEPDPVGIEAPVAKATGRKADGARARAGRAASRATRGGGKAASVAN